MGWQETPIENYLRRRVKEEKGRIRKVKWVGRDGAPDNLVWWPGPRAAFVECKAPDIKVHPKSAQAREITKLRDDGWAVFVVDSYVAVDAAIVAIKKGFEHE